jgi:hypothetical protein
VAARAARRLAAALCLALAGAPAAAAEPEGTAAPTPLERFLQERLLDHYYLLRADVKVQIQESHNVVTSTYPARRPETEVHAITVVTPAGVFYASDYRQAEQVPMGVRSGVQFDSHGQPGLALSPTGQPSIGDVIEVDRHASAALAAGDLSRVVGVEATPSGMEIRLEGLSGTPVPVLLRDPHPEDGTADERGKRALDIFGKLVFLIPEGKEERLAWIDPAWPPEQQQAVREGKVVAGMTPLQVLLAWGTPLHVARDRDGVVDVWLFKRGATLLEQLRNRTDVYIAAGKVAQVVEAGP